MSSKNNRFNWGAKGGSGGGDPTPPTHAHAQEVRTPEQIIQNQAAVLEDFGSAKHQQKKGRGSSISSTGSGKAQTTTTAAAAAATAAGSGRYRPSSPAGGPPSAKADDASRRAQAVAILNGKTESSKKTPSSFVVHVRGKVIAGGGEGFYRHTLSQARSSVLEPGLLQYYVLNAQDDPSEFLVIEVCNTTAAHDDHRATSHYTGWKDAVNDLLVEPTTATKYTTLYPPKAAWKKMDASAASSCVALDGHMKALPWKYKPFSAASPDAPHAPALSMFAVSMEMEVKPGCENSFIEETIINCRQSVKEPGVHRFDFLRNAEQKNKFILFKVYSNPSAQNDHFQTLHYQRWVEAVADWMAAPRKATRWATRFPFPLYWHRGALVSYEDGADDGARRGLAEVPGHGFAFLSPKLHVGRGIAIADIKTAVTDLKINKPFVVTGKGGYQRCSGHLHAAGVYADAKERYVVANEPTVDDAKKATASALAAGCDGVLAVGGGSVIDLGKAVAVFMTNHDDIDEYLEVAGIGKSPPFFNKPVPVIAVPTTAGTGSEVTKTAVLKCAAKVRKFFLRHDFLLPAFAIVDPSLSLTCPTQATAYAGLSALTQLIETYVANALDPVTTALARDGLLRAARSLRAAVADSHDTTAREDLAVAAIFSGYCLNATKLGVVQGYATAIGGVFEAASYGAICGALLPTVFRKKVERLMEEADGGNKEAERRLGHYTEVSRILTGNPSATAEHGAIWLDSVTRDLRVPTLLEMCGVKEIVDETVHDIVKSILAPSNAKSHMVSMSADALEEILKMKL